MEQKPEVARHYPGNFSPEIPVTENQKLQLLIKMDGGNVCSCICTNS